MNYNVQDTQNTKNTRWGAQLSAYLDDELTPAEARALKDQIAEQPDLRQELEEMRMTREVMRSVLLQTPPRNYLLTPSMVAAEKPSQVPAPRSRRMPLLLLRLATSLAAIAFIITVGLGYVQNTARPAAQLTRDMPQSEAASMERAADIEQMETGMESATEEESFGAMEATTPAPAGTLSPQDEMALSEVPKGSAEGIGGGAEPMPEEEAAPLAAQQQETEEADIENSDVAVAADTNGEGAEEAAGAEGVAIQADEPLAPPNEPEATAPETPEDRGQRATFPPKGLSAVLGILTLILAAITFWVSRRT